MAKYWTLHDIPWQQFDALRTNTALISAIKAAALVEFNGYDYSRYLCAVFSDDLPFQCDIRQWGKEEVQHGIALRKWAELADPAFNFEQSFARFICGYTPPLNTKESIRGSRSGELIARCVVESGTSAYYTAIKNYTDEPVLKNLCARIAADEYRHYKLFYSHLNRYLDREGIRWITRFKIALLRVAESGDDELAYAYYAANIPEIFPYDRARCKKEYMSAVYRFYHAPDIEKMVGMVMKSLGLTPGGKLQGICNLLAWNILKFQARRATIAA